ncbi:DUF1631 domain-containing protein [soil metagenome]
MAISRNVIQLARERALFRFTALATPMLKDAEASILENLSVKQSANEIDKLNAASRFLRNEGGLFLRRFESVYRAYLERAMQTMYSDLRLGLSKVSASELTLIDDETVNRQIQVDRLLLRMREADDENLSRLNIMIAQLHGHDEVKERENPFRPYLIAQTLHQVLREKVPDEAVAKVLFDYLSNALAAHLSEYYAAIRAVFEANGVQARLQTRTSKYVASQRYVDPIESSARFNQRVLPGLQRMMEAMQARTAGAAGAPGAGQGLGSGAGPGTGPGSGEPAGQESGPERLQKFVRGLFNPAASSDSLAGTHGQGDGSSAAMGDEASSESVLPPASAELLSRLSQFQQQAARGHFAGGQNAPDPYQLSAFGQQAEQENVSGMERVTIDVVAMLFEYILEDEQIPASLRGLIARLQIPFLKAAMLEPEMLRELDHPARKLLNRMGSAAVGLDPATPVGKKISDEMTGIIRKILTEFDDDIGIFSSSLDKLEASLEEILRHADSNTELSVEAVEAAELDGGRLAAVTKSLQAFMLPLKVDQRVHEFITTTWARVICLQPAENESPEFGATRTLLADLVWSAQEKQDAAERSMLIRMLPDLVKRLKDGLLTIRLPENECKEALDQFVTIHMDVLHLGRHTGVHGLLSLEKLREYFAGFEISAEGPSSEVVAEAAPPQAPEPFDPLARTMSVGAIEVEVFDTQQDPLAQVAPIEPVIQAEVLQVALAQRGASATLDLDAGGTHWYEPDSDWLTQMQLGICVERWFDGAYHLARLTWISKKQTIYMFKLDEDAKTVVYSALSLKKALREGSLQMVESAPVFDRAVESLLQGTQAMPVEARV